MICFFLLSLTTLLNQVTYLEAIYTAEFNTVRKGAMTQIVLCAFVLDLRGVVDIEKGFSIAATGSYQVARLLKANLSLLLSF